MSLKTQTSRQLIKRSTVTGATPTIPSGSTNHTDGTWTVDNIYPGEFYWNMADRKLFLGSEYSGVTNVELIYDFSATSSTLTGGTFNSGTGTLTLNNSNSTSVQVTGFTSGGSFTGGSGNCITDLYLTNMYGCSPITIHDNFIQKDGTSVNSEDTKLKITFDDSGDGVFKVLKTGDTANPNITEEYIQVGSTGVQIQTTTTGGTGIILCENTNFPNDEINVALSSSFTTGEVTSIGLDPDFIAIGASNISTGDVLNLIIGQDLFDLVISGVTAHDINFKTRINDNSYHSQSYKSSTGLYQQTMVTESTPNDTSAYVSLQTSSASTLTMGMASGTTYSQMRFGPAVVGLPNAYADIRVSATTEGYIEVEENLITISPNLLVTNTITATTISATTYQNLPSSTTTLYKQITANTTTTNLTYTDVAGLAISASTTGVYEISAVLLTGSDTAAGIRIGMSVPASSTDFYYMVMGTNTAAANQTFVEGAASGSLVTTFACNSANNQTGITKIDGIVTTTQSGEIKIGFAKITSGTATIRAGSYIRITKIA